MCADRQDRTLEEILAGMHPKEPFRLAVFGSGKSPAQLCKDIGCSDSWLRRVLDDENFYPSYPRLPRFCQATGSDLPLRWLIARGGETAGGPALSADELLAAMVAMQAKLGEAGAAALDAAKDGLLDPWEIKRQMGTMTPLLHAALGLMAKLRSALFAGKRAARPARKGL